MPLPQDAQTTECVDSLRESESCAHASAQEDSFEPLLREAAVLSLPLARAWLVPQRDQLIDGKYRVHEPLGVGGMGAVLRATHLISGKQVALKWLLPTARLASARFVREARAAARVDHPNVVDVYDLGTHEGGHYLVMELLRGRTLAEHMCGRRLAPDELLQILIPTLHGLAAAHAQGVIHRDLKPDNVFLCEAPDGSARGPKLLDFGVSKILADCDHAQTLTGAKTALGTLPYMSPEQLQDAPAVDARTDIYAAGVVMYEALTGRRPFRAGSAGALVLAILAQQPVPPRALEPSVPPELERIVLRAMAKDPRERYPEVAALIQDLCAWADGNARATETATQTRRAPRAWLHGGALALLLAAGAWMGAAAAPIGRMVWLARGPARFDHPQASTDAHAQARLHAAAAATRVARQASEPRLAAPAQTSAIVPAAIVVAAPARARAVARDALARLPRPAVHARAGSIRISDL